MAMTKKATNINQDQLVALLKKRDESALSLLYEKYSLALFGVIFRLLGDQKLAEEQLQECFLKIWNSIDTYDATKGRLFTWMLMIARNSAIDATRKKSFRKNEKTDSLDTNVSIIEKANRVDMDVDHIGIKEVIRKLNTKYANIIDLLYFQGYSQSEAAEYLDLPLGTVKTRARTAIQSLKNLLS
jgi:RNA polymerase sigma-70 factor (ECF subfamily)